MKAIKRLSTEQFMEMLFSMAGKDGRLGDEFVFEGKRITTDYASSRSFEYPPILLTNYEWDLIATPDFGGCEGIYLDIALRGVWDEGQTEAKSQHIGTVKSLDTTKETLEAFGALGGNLVYHARDLANGMLGRFSPKQEIDNEISRAETAGKTKFYLVFPHDEDNKVTGERGYVLCYASERQWAEKWQQASIYKDFKAYMLNESEYKEAGFRLPWLDYVIVR